MRLIFKLIKNYKFRLLVLLITTGLISYICLLSFNESLLMFDDQSAFVRAGLADKLIIYFDEAIAGEKEISKLNEIVSEVKALEDVEGLSTLLPREFYLYDKSKNLIFACDVYEQIYNENYQFDLAEGRLPRKDSNEVLISEDGKNYYGTGDVIHTEILYFEQNYKDDGETDYSERKYKQPAELTVVGIIKNESTCMSPFPGGSPVDLFGRKVSESSGEESPLIISYGCRDVNGELLKQDDEYQLEQQVLIAELNASYSLSEAKEHIDKIIRGYGKVKTGYEIIEDDIESNWDVFRPYIVYGSVALFLVTVSMVSMYIFQIKRGMKALVSYYICGSTWNSIIVKICLINILATLLGYWGGEIIVKIVNSPFKDFTLLTSAKLITIVLIISIQFITSLAFFLSVHKMSPVDIRRREDE